MAEAPSKNSDYLIISLKQILTRWFLSAEDICNLSEFFFGGGGGGWSLGGGSWEKGWMVG